MITETETPRSHKAWKESIDDTGCVTRMEPIWETMEALERENAKQRTSLAFAASVIKSGESWTPTCERMIGIFCRTQWSGMASLRRAILLHHIVSHIFMNFKSILHEKLERFCARRARIGRVGRLFRAASWLEFRLRPHTGGLQPPNVLWIVLNKLFGIKGLHYEFNHKYFGFRSPTLFKVGTAQKIFNMQMRAVQCDEDEWRNSRYIHMLFLNGEAERLSVDCDVSVFLNAPGGEVRETRRPTLHQAVLSAL
jgi:hypothetical protein